MIQFENDELICCIDSDFLNLPDYVPQINDEFISGTTKMWPIRFVEGSQPGKRKKDDVGRENVLGTELNQRRKRERLLDVISFSV